MFENIYHAVYPAIDASQPRLAQHGKTVLITGGGSGIGFAIAKQFAVAGASRIILIGRRLEKLLDAKEHLKTQISSFHGDVNTYVCDIADTGMIEDMWQNIQSQGITVDVLVLNAAFFEPAQAIFQKGWRHVWMQYEINVRANIVLSDSFIHQAEKTQAKKFLINLSSDVIHDHLNTGRWRTYAFTKSAITCLLQHLANELSVDIVQVINFHPGDLYTDLTSQVTSKGEWNWDDESLPANYAVWAATDEASFIHGRFVWAGWGVDEIRTTMGQNQLLESSEFLKVGVTGL